MAYLCVLWKSDNSVSVVARNSKSVTSLSGKDISFKWPRKGIFQGTVVASSDSKKEMEVKANEMAKGEESQRSESDSSGLDLSHLSDGTIPNSKKRSQSESTTTTTTTTKKRRRKIVSANLEACNATAREIFTKKTNNNITAMQLEIDRLRKELEEHRKHQDHGEPDVQNSSPQVFCADSSSDTDDAYEKLPSAYEQAVQKRREENRQLMKKLGLLKESRELVHQKPKKTPIDIMPSATLPCVDPPPKINEQQIIYNEQIREKVPIQKIELVKNMGILIRSSSLAAILRRSKRQPTRVLRFLMEELFTDDELRMSTVRGKKGKLPALDTETMDAILCFTMGKAEEWGMPITEEALVRQGNEKCYQHRKKKDII